MANVISGWKNYAQCFDRALVSARAMTTSKCVTAAFGRGAIRFDSKQCALHHARSAKKCKKLRLQN